MKKSLYRVKFYVCFFGTIALIIGTSITDQAWFVAFGWALMGVLVCFVRGGLRCESCDKSYYQFYVDCERDQSKFNKPVFHSLFLPKHCPYCNYERY